MKLRNIPIIVLAAVALAGAQAPVAATASGAVRGRREGTLRVFLGIPYAAPPLGALRWRPPQPLAPWDGVRDATRFGHHCMQLAPYGDMHFRDAGESEDCLTLNVWTPAASATARLPVMVWIHGGGFVAGAGDLPDEDGAALARHGIVVVTLNYRLGLFGFLALPGFAAESAHHAAGDYGLMDQTAALRWVERNIAVFGGDPAAVTIAGESAGAFSVSAQMAAPSARGLFARAIGESGAALYNLSLPFQPLAQREAADAAWARVAFGTANPAKLRSAPAAELMLKLAAHPYPNRAHFVIPDTDGWFLPQSVEHVYATGRQARVPLLAGFNRDEPTALAAGHPSPASFRAVAQKEFGARARQFLTVFPAATPAQTLRSAIEFGGDGFVVFSTWAWAGEQAATGAPVYRYRFDRSAPSSVDIPAGSGAFHSDEIVYVFGTLDSRTGAHWQKADYQLSALMQTYWSDFVRTGDPNAPGAPAWPRYDAADHWPVLYLNAKTHAAPERQRPQFLFLKSVWER